MVTEMVPVPELTGVPFGGVNVIALSCSVKSLLVVTSESTNAVPQAMASSAVAVLFTRIDVPVVPVPAQVLAVAPQAGVVPSLVVQVQTPAAPALAALPTVTETPLSKFPPSTENVGALSLYV